MPGSIKPLMSQKPVKTMNALAGHACKQLMPYKNTCFVTNSGNSSVVLPNPVQNESNR